MTLLVDDHDTVGVAVERDADVGAHLADFLAKETGMHRTAFLVDVCAVWLIAAHDRLGSQFMQDTRG